MLLLTLAGHGKEQDLLSTTAASRYCSAPCPVHSPRLPLPQQTLATSELGPRAANFQDVHHSLRQNCKTSGDDGGAVKLGGGTKAEFASVRFQKNRATDGASCGAIDIGSRCAVELVGCDFVSNDADYVSGAIGVDPLSVLKVTGSRFTVCRGLAHAPLS